jgi:hypothetical protein
MNENPVVPDQRDWLRMLGGVLFAAGAIIVFFRESENWAEFPLLLTVLIPCALLYGLGLAGGTIAPARPGVAGPSVAPFPWQTVYLVFGVILMPVALLQFVDTIGGSPDDGWNITWVFLLTAAAALFASFRRGVRYSAFLGAVALLIAWLVVWVDKILDDPGANTIRWLLLIFAVLLAVGALALWESWQPQGLEYLTVAGVAILGVGLTSLTDLAEQIRGLRGLDFEGATPNFFWNAVLLLSALALIAFAARTGARGSGYMGGLILLLFMVIVGFDLADVLKGDERSTTLGFWDIVLLLGGAAGIAGSFVLGGNGGPAGPAPTSPAGGGATPASPPGESPPAA